MSGTIDSETRILVAARNVEDAKLVADLLRADFERVHTNHDPQCAVQDFEQFQPNVLVLAFKALEDSERYYLGLYRLSNQVHAIPHRTLVLCHRSDAYQTFELCRKQHFDDYVVFWPVHYDPQRLSMAALTAARAGAVVGPSAMDFAAQARRIAELEGLLQRSLTRGNERIADVSVSLREVETNVGRALDQFSRQMVDGSHRDLVEIRNRAGFEQELDRLREVDLAGSFQAINKLLDPVRQWVGSFKEELAPQLESIRALAELAGRLRPLILMVDDDEFQHVVLQQQMAEADIELRFASSGTQALAMLRTLRPDLILMDFELPDISGVEVTRRLKQVPATAAIPVILVTGTSTKEVLQASHGAGAVDFMVKPVDRARLLAGIQRQLHGYTA